MPIALRPLSRAKIGRRRRRWRGALGAGGSEGDLTWLDRQSVESLDLTALRDEATELRVPSRVPSRDPCPSRARRRARSRQLAGFVS